MVPFDRFPLLRPTHFGPRDVKVLRMAEQDIARLHPGQQAKVWEAIEDLRAGRAQVEPKERPPLIGSYTVRVTNSLRLGLYLTEDQPGGDPAPDWVVYWVGAHNYQEAERRMMHNAGAYGPFPEDVTFGPAPSYEGHPRIHPDWPGIRVKVRGEYAGHLYWDPETHTIADVYVVPHWQRRGIATELLRRAREIDPYLRHSYELTPDGRAWAERVAGALPPGIEFEVHVATEDERYRQDLGGKVYARLPGLVTAEGDSPIVGRLVWRADGEIMSVYVAVDQQRQGIATEMLRRAREAVPYRIFHSDDLTPDGAAWAERVAKVFVPDDPSRYGDTSIRYELGGNGPVMDPRDLPPVLYHVSPVADRIGGVLHADHGGTSGLGGNSGEDRSVSFTISREVAEDIASAIVVMVTAARAFQRIGRGRAFYEYLVDLAADDGWTFNGDGRGWLDSYDGWDFGDWMRFWFQMRDSNGGKRNPLFFGVKAEHWAAYDPRGVGYVTATREDIIASGAMVTDFDLGSGRYGLQEVRVWGDVKVSGMVRVGARLMERMARTASRGIPAGATVDVVVMPEGLRGNFAGAGTVRVFLPGGNPDGDTYWPFLKDSIGFLRWAEDGEIMDVWVHPDFRRQGIATEMLARAREVYPTVRHSETLTQMGREWSRAVAKAHAALTVRTWDGRAGDPSHLTKEITGLVPTSLIADLSGRRGEVPGAHRNKQGPEWEAFLEDIDTRGIQDAIFIVVEETGEAFIYEGNHRRDAAVELGLDEVPVEIRFFGKSEDIHPLGKIASQHVASDYWGGHRPFEDGDPLHDLGSEGTFPQDVYDHPEWYSFDGYEREIGPILRAVRGKPDAMVTIYRALPPGAPRVINTGDWVTLSERYARQHAMNSDDPTEDWPVISAQVPARTVRSGGNDIIEWGYWGGPVLARTASMDVTPAFSPTYLSDVPGAQAVALSENARGVVAGSDGDDIWSGDLGVPPGFAGLASSFGSHVSGVLRVGTETEMSRFAAGRGVARVHNQQPLSWLADPEIECQGVSHHGLSLDGQLPVATSGLGSSEDEASAGLVSLAEGEQALFGWTKGGGSAGHDRNGTYFGPPVNARTASLHTASSDIYAAEALLVPTLPRRSLRELKGLARRVLADEGYPAPHEVDIYADATVFGRASTQYTPEGAAAPEIALGLDMMNDLTLLHELAHVIEGGYPYMPVPDDHGPRWRAIYARLLSRYLPEAHSALAGVLGHRTASSGLTFTHHPDTIFDGQGLADASWGVDTLAAYDGGRLVGVISWYASGGLTDGGVDALWVHEDYRRRGIATELLARAKAIYPAVNPLNTPWFTDDGKAFVNSLPGIHIASIGGYLKEWHVQETLRRQGHELMKPRTLATLQRKAEEVCAAGAAVLRPVVRLIPGPDSETHPPEPDGTIRIDISRENANLWSVLHECAHVLCYDRGMDDFDNFHGPGFREVFWGEVLAPYGITPDMTRTASSLTLEEYISVAEEAVERGHPEAGRKWHLPDKADYPKAYENPDYWEAMRPVTEYVKGVLASAGKQVHSSFKVIGDGWTVTSEGVQGATDGANWIDLRNPATTLTILHECAHVIRGTGEGAGHDKAFVDTLADLIARHISPAARDQFMALVGSHHSLAAAHAA